MRNAPDNGTAIVEKVGNKCQFVNKWGDVFVKSISNSCHLSNRYRTRNRFIQICILVYNLESWIHYKFHFWWNHIFAITDKSDKLSCIISEKVIYPIEQFLQNLKTVFHLPKCSTIVSLTVFNQIFRQINFQRSMKDTKWFHATFVKETF